MVNASVGWLELAVLAQGSPAVSPDGLFLSLRLRLKVKLILPLAFPAHPPAASPRFLLFAPVFVFSIA